jgi:hypothetical protein
MREVDYYVVTGINWLEQRPLVVLCIHGAHFLFRAYNPYNTSAVPTYSLRCRSSDLISEYTSILYVERFRVHPVVLATVYKNIEIPSTQLCCLLNSKYNNCFDL